jgi:hypothetical protein
MSGPTTQAFDAVGTIVSISASLPTTHDAAGFGAITAGSFKEIGEVMTIGEHGAKSSEKTRTPLKSGTVRKTVGATDFGNVQYGVSYIPGDDGQKLCDTARKNRALHSFKIAYPTGDVEYFTARVLSRTINPGGADQAVLSGNIEVSIDDEIVWVDPA